jgi:hypothetical protein
MNVHSERTATLARRAFAVMVIGVTVFAFANSFPLIAAPPPLSLKCGLGPGGPTLTFQQLMCLPVTDPVFPSAQTRSWRFIDFRTRLPSAGISDGERQVQIIDRRIRLPVKPSVAEVRRYDVRFRDGP